MDIIAPLAKHVLDRLVAGREGSTHLRTLAELERSQYFSPEQLRQLQLERLKRLLVHAEQNCPFYADVFSRFGFDPARMTHPDEITGLPVITKADIQKHRDRLRATNYSDQELVENQTGGSTGAPLRFFVDRQRLFSRKAATIRHDRWAGWDIGCKTGVLWGNRADFPGPASLKAKLKTFFYDRRLILDTSDITQAKLDEFTARLRKFKPRVFLAYANSIFLYARYLKERNIRDFHRPESIITSAELLTDEQRTLIEGVFGCKVFNRYGCRETSVVASECSEHAGLHIAAEHLFVEFACDSRSGDPGNPGKIIITDLLNYGMPLIRYEIEDLGLAVEGSCPCGRVLPLMKVVGGRTTDFLITPEGKVVSGASMTIYFIATIPGITQAQIVQKQKDFLVLRFVKGKRFDNRSLEVIRQKVVEFFGAKMKYELEFVDHIPPTSSGKHRFSISELDPMEYLA